MGGWKKVCDIGKTRLCKARVFKTHYEAKVRGTKIIQVLYMVGQ